MFTSNPLVFLFYTCIFLYFYLKFLRGEIKKEYLPVIAAPSENFKNIIEKICKNELVINFVFVLVVSLLPIAIALIFYPFDVILSKIFEVIKTKQQEQLIAVALPGVKVGKIYIPFLEGILSILLIAFLHELSHAILAKYADLNIKSAGFGLFFIIPFAFVEIDEKMLEKIEKTIAISILAAGPIINVVTGFSAIIFANNYVFPKINKILEDRVEYYVKIVGLIPNTSAYYAKVKVNSTIFSINEEKVRTLEDLRKILEKIPKNQTVILNTSSGVYKLNFTKIGEKYYIGIKVIEEYKIKKKDFLLDLSFFIINFFKWFFILSVSLGIMNLYPLPITDGGKILYLILKDYGKLGNYIMFVIYLISTTILIFAAIISYIKIF